MFRLGRNSFRFVSSSIKIDRLDHLVLTVTDIDRTKDFYENAFGMTSMNKNGRWSIHFGEQKINLHKFGEEFEPKSIHPTPGSADLCFISSTPMTKIIEQLKESNVKIVEGPVRRTGAQRSLMSIYCRDPDFNLIEIANEIDSSN